MAIRPKNPSKMINQVGPGKTAGHSIATAFVPSVTMAISRNDDAICSCMAFQSMPLSQFPVHMEFFNVKKVSQTEKYSRPSMARTLMARFARLFRTRSSAPWKKIISPQILDNLG